MADFIPLEEKHIAALDAWFQSGNSDKWLGHVGYAAELYALQKRFPNRHCFVVFEHAEPIALIDLEINENSSAWMSLVVRPDARGKGIGKNTLRAFLDHPVLTKVSELHIEIEEDNEASLRCFQAVGFVACSQPDTTEGFCFLSMKLNKNR